jgi:hypothetical protein
MENYLNQLLNDLKAAHREPLANVSESMEDHFREVDRYVSGDGKMPFSQHCGMQTEQFPREHLLTEAQAGVLNEAVAELMHSWNLSPSFPEQLPELIKYRFLRVIPDHEVLIMDFGTTHIEFCVYDSKNCPFGAEYCTCKQFSDQY